MSFFDDEPEKKPKKKQVNSLFEGEHVPNKSRRRRNQKQKPPKQQKNLQSLEKSILFPALTIKSYLENNEQIQQPLQEYVQEMYKAFECKKHNKVIQSFEKEDDEGNIEYKLKLVNPTEDRLDHLATQMKYRVKEGSGEGYYRIGVEDNGKPLGLSKQEMYESLKTICYLANKIRKDVMVLRVSEGHKGLIIELMIREIQRQGIKLEIRCLMFGESGSGKSTLLGGLKSGEKDDGKGKCRLKVFTHKEEFLSGITMTKSLHVIGFDSHGRLANQQGLQSTQKWLDNVNKLISIIDVGGHKKAEKQLVSSLCSFFPEYAMWVVNGKQNPNNNQNFDTDNLQLAKVFNLPLIVVITHLDEMNKDQEIDSVYNLKQFLKKLYPDKTPCVIKEMEYAVLFSRITSTEDVIPIFLTSNVTGKNIDLLTSFLNLLTSVSEIKNNEELHTEFLISDTYTFENKHILAGTVIKGSLKRGQILHLGPDSKGTFRAVEVNSIQCIRVPVKYAKCGQVCTVGIKLNNYAKEWIEQEPNAIRRGMVLVESKTNPKAAHEFSAEFTLYRSNKDEVKITRKYQPVINTLTIRQICNIVSFTGRKNVDDLEVPDMMLKKKSKSIDNFGVDKIKNFSVSQEKVKKSGSKQLSKNLSMVNPQSKYEEKSSPKLFKKSLDLTPAELDEIEASYSPSMRHSTKEIRPQDRKVETLETIAEENQAKKKKEVEEIIISQNAPIVLRLRFKYSPQYISVGQIVVINELKMVGKIKQIHY